MNFQTVSTAEKLPTSDGLAGGYNADGTPGPLLSKALDYIDAQVGAMQSAIHQQRPGRAAPRSSCRPSTASRRRTSTSLRRVDDGAIIDALNAAWAAAHPGAAPLVTFSVDDDACCCGCPTAAPAALAFAKQLPAHAQRAGQPGHRPEGRLLHDGAVVRADPGLHRHGRRPLVRRTGRRHATPPT